MTLELISNIKKFFEISTYYCLHCFNASTCSLPIQIGSLEPTQKNIKNQRALLE